MIELCYPTVAHDDRKLTEQDIPVLIECVRRLNRGVAFMQEYADQLAGEQ
jgi:hypothetical protein